MVLLIYGITWIIIVGGFLYLSYCVDFGLATLMSENSQEEDTMFKIFFAILILIGVGAVIKGLIQIFNENKAKKEKKEYYSMVVYPGSKSLKLLSIDVNNKVSQIEGLVNNAGKYCIGDILKTKHYKNHIFIVKQLSYSEIPLDKVEMFKKEYPEFFNFPLSDAEEYEK